MDNDATHQIPLRLPKPLYKRLADKAKRNVRSVNAEIIVAVQHHLGVAEQPAAQPDEAPQKEG